MSHDFGGADRLVFADPASEPGCPCAVLHLLRRGVVRSMPCDLWLAAFGLVGGIDHLSRLRYGDVTPAWRFRHALTQDLRLEEGEVGAVTRFWGAVGCGSQPDGEAVAFELVGHGPMGGARVNVPDLHRQFEAAVMAYRHELAADPGLRAAFLRMFNQCGLMTIGRAAGSDVIPPDGTRHPSPVAQSVLRGREPA
jgi:hypothetical protein